MPRNPLVPVLVLSLGLIVGASTTALSQDKTDKPVMRGGRHPHIYAAGRALQHAATQLEKAPHGFGGHRAKALDLVRQAEQELRHAMTWAHAHPEEFKKDSKKE